MAISVTAPTLVVAVSGSQTTEGIAGATITAGQVLYLDSSTKTYKLADRDTETALAEAKGIALNACSTGQSVRILTKGKIDLGTAGDTKVGKIYVVSTTAGGIDEVDDIALGVPPDEYVTILGVGHTTQIINVNIFISGVVADEAVD